MWGIVKKDFYDTFCIPKNLLGNLGGYLALFLCAFIIGPGRVALPLFLVLCIPMTTVSVLQAALEQDEMVKFDDIMLTYPLTKKEIVLARFIDNMIYVGINAVISVLMMLVYVYGAKTTDLQTGLLYCALGLVVSLVTTAVFSVGFYILGNKKGTILYIALVLVATISYCFTQLNFSFAWILNMNPWMLFAIGLVIGILFMLGSYWGCVKIYTRHHS